MRMRLGTREGGPDSRANVMGEVEALLQRVDETTHADSVAQVRAILKDEKTVRSK
jgi:hypothetical protein